MFGFHPALTEAIFGPIVRDARNMEMRLSGVHEELGATMHRLPPLVPLELMKRGDGSILDHL